MIEKDSLEEDAPVGFSDDFEGPALDSAWTVVKGQGSYSLTENPGHLGLRVGGSHTRAPILLLFRRFRGEHWTLETKASYFTGTSGGSRDLSLLVSFGRRPSAPQARNLGDADLVSIARSRGDYNGCCRGTTRVFFCDKGSPSEEPAQPNYADTYVWRIKRNGRIIAVERSDDGISFTVIATHTFGPQLDGLIQYVGLTYGNWQNKDAYADYDYIRLTKTEPNQAPSGTPSLNRLPVKP